MPYYAQGSYIDSTDIHFSYLPLAHVMERTAHVLFFMCGAKIGFYSGDLQTMLSDVQELKPTIFMSVPRLLNKMYDKVSYDFGKFVYLN